MPTAFPRCLREDYAEVHKLQDEFKLVPLSSYGKPYRPPAGTVDPSIDMKTAVRRRLLRDPPDVRTMRHDVRI